jgi:hypothetical protein
LLALGLGNLANGTWMFIDPLHWYHELPAGVPDFGDFNPHFVRDIACAFVTVGVALAVFFHRHEGGFHATRAG